MIDDFCKRERERGKKALTNFGAEFTKQTFCTPSAIAESIALEKWLTYVLTAGMPSAQPTPHDTMPAR